MQLNEPGVFEQEAFWWQISVLFVHSSMSAEGNTYITQNRIFDALYNDENQDVTLFITTCRFSVAKTKTEE